MRGAARAIAWELGRHHRFGFALLAAYLLAFVALKAWLLPDARLRFDPPNGLAAFVMVPVTMSYFFFVGVFTYGLTGDLAARESIFPKRMLTLPVKTAALAAWPMLYGAITAVILWIATVFVARWTSEASVLPVVWPGLVLVAWLAWMQALTWMPYGLRGVRVVAAIAWLVMVDAIVLGAIYSGASEATMVAILAPQLPLAYLVAWYAVSRARQGEVPDWSLSRSPGSPAARRKDDFRSAAHAQAWLEWRRHGWTLPLLVGAVVPFELLLLFIPGNDTPWIVFGHLFVVMLTPPVMALLAAPAFGSFTTFAATRPLTSAALVAPKLRVALMSTVVAWTIAATFTVAILAMSGTLAVLVDKLREVLEFGGPVRGPLLIALPVALLVGATWKNLVQSLCIGLTGNPWLIRSTVLLVFAAVIAIGPLLYAFGRSEAARFFAWEYLPWIIAAVVCAKLLAAGWIAVRLHEARVFSEAVLLGGTVAWLAAVGLLFAFVQWFVGAPIFPFYFVAALAFLVVPLVRVSAAPLALARARHR